MKALKITPELLAGFAGALRNDERSEATVARYTRAVRQYGEYLAGARPGGRAPRSGGSICCRRDGRPRA